MDIVKVNLLLQKQTSALKTAFTLLQVKMLWQINDVSKRAKVMISGQLGDLLVAMTPKRQSHGGACDYYYMWSQSLCPGHKWPAPSGAASSLNACKFPNFVSFVNAVNPTHDTVGQWSGLIPHPLTGAFFLHIRVSCTIETLIFIPTSMNGQFKRPPGSISERRPLYSTGRNHDPSSGFIPHALAVAKYDFQTSRGHNDLVTWRIPTTTTSWLIPLGVWVH